MRAPRCLALPVAMLASLLATAPAQADVTPEAFGNCGQRAARTAILATDAPARVKAALPEGYVPDPGTRLARFYFRPYFVECSDLNGDDRRELIAPRRATGPSASGAGSDSSRCRPWAPARRRP